MMRKFLSAVGLLSIGAAAGLAGEKVYKDYVKTGKLKEKLKEIEAKVQEKKAISTEN